MTRMVALPIWVVLLAGFFTAWSVLGLLGRAARAFYLKREARFLRILRARYKIDFPAFKLVKKRAVVARLLTDPQVLSAVEERSRELGIPVDSALKKAALYAGEIVPSFHAYIYYVLGSLVAVSMARLLYRIRVHDTGEGRLIDRDQPASLVFLINHRSNMDYILLGILTMRRAPLSFAVGEWARVWPVKPLVKSMGAYFVRRNSGDPLYRRILSRYVHIAVEGGLIQAVFPEGRLSRDGRLSEPKLGLLDYMLRGFNPTEGRDIVFIPAGVNYDRVLEDRSLLLDGKRGAKRKPGHAAVTTARFVLRHLWLMVRGGWQRFGYAAMDFAAPLSLRAYAGSRRLDFRTLTGEERSDQVRALAQDLMARIGRSIPVLPVSLMATVFIRNPGVWLTEAEALAKAAAIMEELEKKGAYVYVPRKGKEAAVQSGLRRLLLRRFVENAEGRYRAVPSELSILGYYANAISHLFSLPDSGNKGP